MTTDLYNQEHKKVGTAELPDQLFGAKWNPDLVHQVIVAYDANIRKVIAVSRGRGEVSGGGKKPYKQKHTGRARAGSTRSPIWKGGGVSHGPKADRDFSKKINKKMKRGALASVLSKKLTDGEVFVVDSLEFNTRKTKDVAVMLKNFFDKKPNVLFVSSNENKSLFLSGRNIPKIEITHVSELNAKSVMLHKNLMIEKGAVEELSKAK
ncbi:MAG: 50S ribosomal protein L4 [bacterium]|nr:50S ribosomal protein L4 [Candidatus Jorgensenbacteria bacterium]